MLPHFCTTASDLVADVTGSISGFRFLGWLVVEIELDDGTIGIGNAALSPHATKAVIDTYLKPLPGRSRNTSPRFRSKSATSSSGTF